MLKGFEKFSLTLPELSQICSAELTWSNMLLVLKTLVTPTGFKEMLMNFVQYIHYTKIRIFSLTLEG